jgi:hypothetical protein
MVTCIQQTAIQNSHGYLYPTNTNTKQSWLLVSNKQQYKTVMVTCIQQTAIKNSHGYLYPTNSNTKQS